MTQTIVLHRVQTHEVNERVFQQFCWDNGFPASPDTVIDGIGWQRLGTEKQFEGYSVQWRGLELTWRPQGTCTIVAPVSRQVGYSLERIKARLLQTRVWFDDETLRGLVFNTAVDGHDRLVEARVLALVHQPWADPDPDAVLTVEQLIHLVANIAARK